MSALSLLRDSLERATTDAEVRSALEAVEAYGARRPSARISPLHDVEERMRSSSDRLSAVVRASSRYHVRKAGDR